MRHKGGDITKYIICEKSGINKKKFKCTLVSSNT